MRQITLTHVTGISPAVSGPTIRVIPYSTGVFVPVTEEDRRLIIASGLPEGFISVCDMFKVLISGMAIMVLEPDEHVAS